ncbi:MAG: hypothetical protein LUC94_13565 [Clostridiales bacterium]|nr:hypothetical protein [Clostridiales bacterium]
MSEKKAEKFYKRRVNRQYKDRMFDRIFRIPKNLLSLFNALNGTAWTDADQMEIQAVMININFGRNEALMRACPVLREYAQFVAKTRENIGMRLSVEEAVTKAVNDCINEGILKDLLISWKAEDINMIIEEFTEEEMWELNMKEIEEEARAKGMEIGIAKGRSEGHAEGILDTLIALVRDGLISVKDATLRANLTEEAFINRMGTIEK